MHWLRGFTVSLSACLCACGPNPAFKQRTTEQAATDEAGSSSGTVTGAPTSSGSESSSRGETTVGLSGSASSGDSTTTSADATTADPTTGPAPQQVSVAATIATCVLLASDNQPHGGPAECSNNADGQDDTQLKGLMMVDTKVDKDDGGGRAAHSYLRFDIPDQFATLTVAKATLFVRTSDAGKELPQTGALMLVEAFDDASLATTAPQAIEKLAEDMGTVLPDQWLEWDIDPSRVVAGAPLHLGLFPVSDDGVELCGEATVPGAPYLMLDLQ